MFSKEPSRKPLNQELQIKNPFHNQKSDRTRALTLHISVQPKAIQNPKAISARDPLQANSDNLLRRSAAQANSIAANKKDGAAS